MGTEVFQCQIMVGLYIRLSYLSRILDLVKIKVQCFLVGFCFVI